MKTLPYAVVKFTIDNLIGVICTKWMTADGKHCLYPASKSDLFNMTLILKKEKEAMPGWDKHPVVILGQYATFADAKKHESKAEDTSNLSEDDEDPIGKRKRKPNSKYEESDDDCSLSPPLKNSKPPKHPSLHSFSHAFHNTPLKEINSILNQSSTSSSIEKQPGTDTNKEHSGDNENTNPIESNFSHTSTSNSFSEDICYTPPPKNINNQSVSNPSIHNQADAELNIDNCYNTDSFDIRPIQSPNYSFAQPSPSHVVPHTQFKTPPQKKNFQSPFDSSIHSYPNTDVDRECSYAIADIQPIRRKVSTPNQSRQQKSSELSQVMDKINHLIEMVSALSQRVEELSERVDHLGERQITAQEKSDKGQEVFELLPIEDMTSFDILEKRPAEEEAFRKSFVKSMSTLGGRDPNTLIINVLKACLTDKAAELFSLTGKKMGNIPAKRKFCDTRVCNSIFDAVRRRYKDVTNDQAKVTIKNWLQQATPRIQKREKRQEAAALVTLQQGGATL